MGRRKHVTAENELPLFALNDYQVATARPKAYLRVQYPIWTEHKARLIARYLDLFVRITRHGTYIDGFAGPQQVSNPEMWAVKLVLERQPIRLRHFHLFDIEPKKIRHLEELKSAQPVRDQHGKKIPRDITIYSGDVNRRIHELLERRLIKENEATFCLLDQHTCQCHWDTVKALAEYKQSGLKIEIFYFLASGWLGRAAAARKNKDPLAQWWGRDDWPAALKLCKEDLAVLMENRFKNELGYLHTRHWKITSERGGGNVLYNMIHASDHPEAPELMNRAYRQAVLPLVINKQMGLSFKNLQLK